MKGKLINKYQWGSYINKLDKLDTTPKGLDTSSFKLPLPDLDDIVPKGIGSVSNVVKSKFGIGSLFKNSKATGMVGSIGNAAMDVIGGFAPKLDHTNEASDALNIASSVSGFIPGPVGVGLSLATKGLVLADQLTGKNAKSSQTEGIGIKGYGTSINTNAGTRYGGLFGNKARNATDLLTKRYDTQNLLAGNASYQDTQSQNLAMNKTQDIFAKNTQKQQGGINTQSLIAKNGVKLFQKGGVVNVIPSGALHREKHNLHIVDNEINDVITLKGIPVVSFDDGGEITQSAEIEREEIILHKELTDKLEALLKKFEDGDEEAVIEAGKLLSDEIIENTEDNVGLMDKIV